MILLQIAISRPKNILDDIDIKLNPKREKRVLDEFKGMPGNRRQCYQEGVNYEVFPVYIFPLKRLDDSVLTNEDMFLQSLYRLKPDFWDIVHLRFHVEHVNRYIIYEKDSSSIIAQVPIYSNGYYDVWCNYPPPIDSHDSIYQYAIKNQYLLFSNLGMYYGYKDKKLYIFEPGKGMIANFNVYPFEEFNWNQQYLLPWIEFLKRTHYKKINTADSSRYYILK